MVMGKKDEKEKEQVVVINGEEHNVDDLSQEQVKLLNQVADLENKIRQVSFSLEQTQGARAFFIGQLTASLETKEEPKEAANE